MDLLAKFGKKKNVPSVVPKSNPIAKIGTSTLGRFIFMDFCQQAKVYLVIALFTLIYYVYKDQDYIWVVLKAVLFIFWGFVIDRVCLQNMKAIAWIMAIIPPFIFLFFTIQMPPAIPNAPKTTNRG
jgi:hypothetical protein